MNKPSIVLRVGAAYYDARLTENGNTTAFDLAAMTKGERSAFRRVLVGAYEKILNSKKVTQ